MTKNDDTFIKITNKDIFDKINENHEENNKKFEQILIHQKETNGKVKLAKWIATTALSIGLLAIGIAIEHMRIVSAHP